MNEQSLRRNKKLARTGRVRFFIHQLLLKRMVWSFGWIGFGIITVALFGSLHITREIAYTELIDSTEAANVAFARILQGELWGQVAPLMPHPNVKDPDLLRIRPQAARLDQIIRRFAVGTDLIEIKIYDLTGLTIYSSDPEQIGLDYARNTGFTSARAGVPKSALRFHETLNAFDGEVQDRRVVNSFVPVRWKGQIAAVVEIHNDRTDSIQQDNRAMMSLALLLAPLFYCVYAILLYVVWRADSIRRRNQSRLKIIIDNKMLQLAEQVRKNHEARALAEAASKVKSEFLANMSHEIRTPLTAIIGYAESTLAHNPSEEERLSNLTSIVRNGEHLLSIINDILDLGKIEAGKLEIELVAVELLTILRDVESVSSAHAQRKGIAFDVHYDFPLPVRISTDPTRLKAILLNITNNAIKFTEQGQVILSVGYLAQDAKVRFAVMDTGIGMTADQVAQLFKPFAQADASTSRRFGGSGLGLHISKHLAELLGGTVSATSVAGEGSAFEILIDAGHPRPVDFHSETPHLPAGPPTHALRLKPPRVSGKILLAEDNSDNQRLISLYVQQTGAELVIAANGALAVERAMEIDFDLILMDMQMPVMDGMEATALLRRTGFEGPIFALTASATQQEVERFMSLGCNAVLSKPIDWNILYRILAEHLPQRLPNGMGEVATATPMSISSDTRLRELIDTFVAGLPAWMSGVRTAHARQDWSEVARAVHDMKGMGSGFGYPQLTEFAAAMDQAMKNKNYDVAHYVSALDRLVSEITTGENVDTLAVS